MFIRRCNPDTFLMEVVGCRSHEGVFVELNGARNEQASFIVILVIYKISEIDSGIPIQYKVTSLVYLSICRVSTWKTEVSFRKQLAKSLEK